METGELRFGLSRALGRDASFGRARDFAALLDQVGFATVVPFDSYGKLEHALLAGEIHAAWAPPLICARAEEAGGSVALRAMRKGWPTYGAALLRDKNYRFRFRDLPNLSGLRAAWVDRQSVSGYLLPRHTLVSGGVDLDKTFAAHNMLGSFEDCLLAVLQGHADITACFYRGTAELPLHGYVDLMGDRARFFSVLALSRQVPHDGIALTPALPVERANQLMQVFRAMAGEDRALLATALDADAFDEPAAGTYREVLALLR